MIQSIPPPWLHFPPNLWFFLYITLYLIETPFDAFANRADPDQAALVRPAWSKRSILKYFWPSLSYHFVYFLVAVLHKFYCISRSACFCNILTISIIIVTTIFMWHWKKWHAWSAQFHLFTYQIVSEYDQEIPSFIKLPSLSWDPDFSGQMDGWTDRWTYRRGQAYSTCQAE